MINVVKDKLKVQDFECKLDESWHLLLIHFDYFKKIITKRTHHKVRMYIDNLQKQINSEGKQLQQFFNKNNDHVFAYGCDASDMIGGVKTTTAL